LALTKVSGAASPTRTRRRNCRWREGLIASPRGQFAPGSSAGLDVLGQAGLVVPAEQVVLADVVEIEADQVLLGLRGVLVGH
jgi:hypothetical protein